MSMLIHLAALTGTILVLAKVLPGVKVKNTVTALVVAVVFSLLNFFLAPLMKMVLFLPAVLTLGLLFPFINFIVNAALLWVTDEVLHAFEIKTFKALLISAAAITVVNFILHRVF